jgi:phosphomannomutase
MHNDLDIFRRYDFRGSYPSEIDQGLSKQLARTIGQTANQASFIVGRDQRETSGQIYEPVLQGLEEAGCTVETPDTSYGINGFATTDMIAYRAKQQGKHGIAVTASHMPNDWTGLKPIQPNGRIYNNEEMSTVRDQFPAEPTLGHQPARQTWEDATNEYTQALTEHYKTFFDNDLSGLDICVDPGNAAGIIALPNALKGLGASVQTLYDDPTIKPERDLEPNEHTLGGLSEKVRQAEADFGIATDGDADRVVFVNGEGNVVPGSQPLALLGERYVQRGETGITASIDTSTYVEDVIKNGGGEVKWTPRGAVFTALTCLENNLRWGGQPNGHYMDKEFVAYDSGSLIGTMFAGLVEEKNSSVRELQDALPEQYVENKVFRTTEKDRFMTHVKEEICNNSLCEVISEVDGIKARLKQHGCNAEFTIRPSGTDPVIRVTAGSDNEQQTQDLLTTISREMTNIDQAHF